MLFLIFSNADVEFVKKELKWKSYTIAEILATTRVELIDKRKFTTAVLDENVETFVVHVVTLSAALAM